MLFRPDLNEKAKAASESFARLASSARRRTVSIAIAALIVVGAAYIVWSIFNQPSSTNRQQSGFPVPVLAASPRIDDVPVYLDGVGTVRALNNVTV
ncbi:MAG: efflux RND transporter periplasmic adaptor subunit, partial [Rhizobiales bacterium]|nr:efflux RND transporter periplasmic adaptor subunit [Hyphomicrobiales bacterium]